MSDTTTAETDPTPQEERGLTAEQIKHLLAPVAPQRVKDDGKGHAYLAQQDVRAHLIRIFGFGNWDTKILESACVFESPRPAKDGDRVSPTTRWDVCYRVTMRLTVKDQNGHVIAEYEDGAADTAENQKRGEAHGLAFRSAISLALKRCAISWGDQFGLSLYNKGQLARLVVGTLIGSTPVDNADIPEQVAAEEVDHGSEDVTADSTDDDMAQVRDRVVKASFKPFPDGTAEERVSYIRQAIVARKYDAASVADLNDLASEWENLQDQHERRANGTEVGA